MDLEVAEKALKGRDMTHGVGDDHQVLTTDIVPHPLMRPVAGWNRPVAVFKFRYRSRGALLSAGFMDELGRQLSVVVKQEDDVKQERGIKRERDGDDDEGDKPLRPAQRRRKTARVKTELIEV